MYTSGILPYDVGMVTYNWKITMRLHEDVDPRVLDEAVQRAAERYPYFMKRLVLEDESYRIVDNDAPLVVYDNTEELRALNDAPNNYHLISVAYAGASIDFTISHMLAGACGLVEWIRTVLYLYLTQKHGVSLQVDGVKLPGEEVPVGERQFVTREDLEAIEDDGSLDIARLDSPKHGKIPLLDYALGIALPQFTKKVYYRFEFPQKEFMDKARSSDASPVSLLSALMFKALCQLWPRHRGDIQCMIAHNYRGAVGLPESTCDMVRYIHMRYPEELADAPLEKACMATRGRVLLQSDQAFVLRDAWNVVERIEAVEAQPTLGAKKNYCKKNGLYGSTVVDSCQVSYVGRTQWGDMLPYIASGDIVTEGHLMIEVLSLGDRFCATLQQEVDDEKYRDALAEVFDAEGVVYSVSEPIEKRMPGLVMPS